MYSLPLHMHDLPKSQHHSQILVDSFFFLARMNLLGHDIITQSPYFTSEFTLDVVHSMDLDKCIKTYVYHYNVI